MHTLTELQEKFQSIKNDIPKTVNLRAYRCLTWLDKAEKSDQDLDIKFISLWISFNAAYAQDLSMAMSDRSAFQKFIRLMDRRAGKDLNHVIWSKHKNIIQFFLDNKYVFQGFWDFHNNKISESAWMDDFKKSQDQVRKALEHRDSEKIMLTLFDRIYTLRNQVFHGGASYIGSANREALTDACLLLEDFTLIFLGVILNSPDEKTWGEPFYPYLTED